MGQFAGPDDMYLALRGLRTMSVRLERHMRNATAVAEWLRGWVFTGYAWNPLGVVLLGGFDSPGLAVFAPWLGTYALSGLAALIAAAGCAMNRSDTRAARSQVTMKTMSPSPIEMVQ